jgi:Sortase domain
MNRQTDSIRLMRRGNSFNRVGRFVVCAIAVIGAHLVVHSDSKVFAQTPTKSRGFVRLRNVFGKEATFTVTGLKAIAIGDGTDSEYFTVSPGNTTVAVDGIRGVKAVSVSVHQDNRYTIRLVNTRPPSLVVQEDTYTYQEPTGARLTVVTGASGLDGAELWLEGNRAFILGKVGEVSSAQALPGLRLVELRTAGGRRVLQSLKSELKAGALYSVLVSSSSEGKPRLNIVEEAVGTTAIVPLIDSGSATVELPRTLTISSVGVNGSVTSIDDVTKISNRTNGLEAQAIAWWSQTPRPGSRGIAVIVGHINFGGKPGIFKDLRNVAIGDVVAVTDTSGVPRSFEVYKTLLVRKTSVNQADVFAPTPDAELRVISCEGELEKRSDGSRHYVSNRVVFARLVK